jgi:hypothetical protein
MIFANIAPKPGRLATGSYAEVSPVFGTSATDIFGYKSSKPVMAAGQGGIIMPGVGSPRTETIYGNPLESQRDTATLIDTPAATSNSGRLVNPSTDLTMVGPHERGAFFGRRAQPIVKTQFGASTDKQSDTSFHKVPKKVFRPQQSSGRTGERTNSPSFTSHNNNWSDPNNSFIRGRNAPASGALGTGRWSTTKRGAAG